MSIVLRHGILEQVGWPFVDPSFYGDLYGWSLNNNFDSIKSLDPIGTNTGFSYPFINSNIGLDVSCLYVNTTTYGVDDFYLPSESLSNFNGPFTYSLWFADLQTSTSFIDIIGYLKATCNGTSRLCFALDTYDTVRSVLYTDIGSGVGNESFIADSEVNITGAGLHMLTVTWDASTQTSNMLKLYIDGSLASETQTYGSLGYNNYIQTSIDGLWFNSHGGYNPYTPKATYERIRIWPYVLSPEIINWLYQEKY